MTTETNAERLEMLTNMVDAIDGDFTAQNFGFEMDGQAIVDDMRWLIEQAERALEWEASNARISKIALNRQKYIDELVEENARLRGALEFYANEDVWVKSNISSDPWNPYYVRDIHKDEGDIARQVLAGEPDD